MPVWRFKGFMIAQPFPSCDAIAATLDRFSALPSTDYEPYLIQPVKLQGTFVIFSVTITKELSDPGDVQSILCHYLST